MKTISLSKLPFILGCLLAWFMLGANGQAQTTNFTYQGSLTISGTLATGSYDLQFKLYDQLSGGALQGWPSTVTVSGVTVTAGVFTVELDFGAVAFPGAARFLEIGVRPAGSGGFTTLAPRQQLSSTPYAIRSLSAASADTATTATSATSAANFSGSLSGDVTGTQGATVVSLVGGVTASNVASGATAANNATDANTPATIVKRDASGNFTAGTVTATGFSGGGANLTNLNASNLSSGTLPDARLSSNVATLSGDQIFTGNKAFAGLSGLVATGMEDSGSIPATGAGVRMMWYPGKYAFRAGKVAGTAWDDANVGIGSVAIGVNVKANFNFAVAMGISATSSGNSSLAIGNTITASGAAAVALGTFSTASGLASVAIGASNQASGDYSVALGRFASTNGKHGSFVFNDSASNSTFSSSQDNQFNVRAAGGYRLFASGDTSDETKPGLFISGTTGNTQINGDLSVSGTLSANVVGTATSATNFTGSLTGDVTGTQSATVVSAVGGLSAGNVAGGATAANNATDASTPSAIVKRDASGSFSAGTITATGFSGSGAGLTNLNATNINTGTLDDARLSSNVATLTADQTFTGNKFFSGANGLLATGSFGSGSIPATGEGTRMMWYPKKAAFRAGHLDNFGSTSWDESNVGEYSVAIGLGTKASGQSSTALGTRTTASGTGSVALGVSTTASGFASTALGSYASTNGKEGSFVYGDNSDPNAVSATANHQFVVRAQQMWFGTNNSVTATSGRFLETSTGAYLTTGGTWTNSSSRALKTGFAPVNARATLQKVLQLPIQTWSYKTEGANVRHIGAISQDFNRLFGFGDSAETIATVDADGVAMAAIQGLHEELKDRDARIERLEQQSKEQQALIDGLRKLLCAQTPRAEVCQR